MDAAEVIELLRLEREKAVTETLSIVLDTISRSFDLNQFRRQLQRTIEARASVPIELPRYSGL